MKISGKIITVGLGPSWDVMCQGEGLDWGEHKVVLSSEPRPAGKALNISRALAWMGQRSVAAGIWGEQDYEQMLRAVRPLRSMVRFKMTAVKGRTRQNINVVDTTTNREMHLRSLSELASKGAIRKLRGDLEQIVSRGSVCVFAGAMPGVELLPEVVRVVDCCRGGGARIAVDTSGPALKRIVDGGGVWLIKPNVEELGELAGQKVADNVRSLARAGRKLLDRVEVVLISRGRSGAVVVTADGLWHSRLHGRGRAVLSTVACGDYLLGGFLKGLKDTGRMAAALETGVKVATAKAWGWTDEKKWPTAKRKIKAITVKC